MSFRIYHFTAMSIGYWLYRVLQASGDVCKEEICIVSATLSDLSISVLGAVIKTSALCLSLHETENIGHLSSLADDICVLLDSEKDKEAYSKLFNNEVEHFLSYFKLDEETIRELKKSLFLIPTNDNKPSLCFFFFVLKCLQLHSMCEGEIKKEDLASRGLQLASALETIRERAEIKLWGIIEGYISDDEFDVLRGSLSDKDVGTLMAMSQMRDHAEDAIPIPEMIANAMRRIARGESEFALDFSCLNPLGTFV